MDVEGNDIDFDGEAMDDDDDERSSDEEEVFEEEQGPLVDVPTPLMTEVDTIEVWRTDLVFESKEYVLDHVKKCVW